MAYQYLTKDNIFTRYTAAEKYTNELTVPFPEFERIARNRPKDGIDKNYPKTTDGTTASIIRKTPRRVVQQLPTGEVQNDADDWLSIVADFILSNKILPYANEEYDLIQKCWNIIEGSLSFGAAATYTPFLNHDGYFCPDVTLVYWGDIKLQPGKKSGHACSYVFVRSWWQKEDIEALIDKEKKLAESAKKRKEKYDSSWDTVALQRILDGKQVLKDQQGKTPIERERSINQSGIELITGFQKGVGASFITFNQGSKEVVRTEKNVDPRGHMPIDWMYGDIDGSNPFGRGIIELIGGLQNLIDADMQMYQYNRALMLAPPMVQYGNINNVRFIPNAVMKAQDMNAKIEALTVDTSAVANYPNLYGLQKSQLLNLVNSPDTSISSDMGNPSFSKTDAGVKSQNATVSVDDNYVRKMFESWFEAWAETAINLYFAKRHGIEELQLDKNTAMRLRELPNFDESLLSDDNQIRLDYDTVTPVLKFRVNPSTSTVKDQQAQVQDATSLLDLVMKYPMLNSSYGGPIDTEVLARRIVTNSGIEDPEQVAPEPTAAQKQAKEDAKNKPNPFSPMFDKPSIRMNYPDLPPAAQVQLLANAGVQVTIDDVMQGPVVDPNIRGVFNPINDPNVLVPGGGPAVQTAPGMAAPAAGAAPNPLQQDGINLSPQEIQKLSQDPRFSPQSAAQPQTQQPQQAQSPTQYPEGSPQEESSESPTQEQTEPTQLAPEDEAIIQELASLNVPDQVIAEAIHMLEQGADPQKLLQALGITQGATNG